jgi:hypothetical protein
MKVYLRYEQNLTSAHGEQTLKIDEEWELVGVN